MRYTIIFSVHSEEDLETLRQLGAPFKASSKIRPDLPDNQQEHGVYLKCDCHSLGRVQDAIREAVEEVSE